MIPSSSKTVELDQKYIWHPFTQMLTAGPPLAISRGEGAMLYDEQGNAYIDAISSWWVNLHGHAHPYIARRVYEQMQRLEHVIFAGFTHQPAVQLAERLLAHLPDNQSRLFFSDNGSTAVEVAIKMAIQYFYNRGEKRNTLIALHDAYHGDTFGAMSAGGDLPFYHPFKDQLFEVLRVPVPVAGQEEKALQTMEALLEEHRPYAFLYEPLVQGSAGMVMYEPGALDGLLHLAKMHGVLCIADEVMTGFGRTGRFFASDFGMEKPDMVCMSKGLTGGNLPMALTSCTAAVYESFLSEDKSKTFFHGHSFTGNPVGCAAALASLDLLEEPSCWESIRSIEEQHRLFAQDIAGHPALKEVRQRGTILALEFQTGEGRNYFSAIRDQLYDFFLKRGILLRPLGNVIYILPPYCISSEQLTAVYTAIGTALDQFVS